MIEPNVGDRVTLVRHFLYEGEGGTVKRIIPEGTEYSRGVCEEDWYVVTLDNGNTVTVNSEAF